MGNLIDVLFISDYFNGLDELISSLNRYLNYTTKYHWTCHLNYLKKNLNDIEKLKIAFITNNIDDLNDLLKRHYSYVRIFARNSSFPHLILTFSKVAEKQREKISKIKIKDAKNKFSNFKLVNLNISNLKKIKDNLSDTQHVMPDIWYFKHHDVAKSLREADEKIIKDANNPIGKNQINLKLDWKILVIDDDMDNINDTQKKLYFEWFHRYLNKILSLKVPPYLSNKYGKNKIVNYLSFNKVKEKFPSIEHQLLNLDIVFIDIIEESEGKHNLTGLQEILPKIKQFRGVYKFPLIIMLSRLRAYEIGDLAIEIGADYYLNKDDFFLQYPYSLNNILTNILRRERNLNDEYFNDEETEKILNGSINLGILNQTDYCQDYKRLLFLLFRKVLDKRKLEVIKVFSKGKSGALTFLAKIYREDVEDEFGKSSIQRIVKIDSADNMVFEKNAYEKHISPYIENFAGRIESLSVYKEFAAISYTSVGSRIDYEIGGLLDLEEFILQNPDYNTISSAVNTIFSEILSPIHSQNIIDVNNIKFNTIFNYFKNYLPSLKKIKKFDDNDSSEVRSFEIMSVSKNKIKFRDLKTNDIYQWDESKKSQLNEIKKNVLFRVGKRFKSNIIEETNSGKRESCFFSNFNKYSEIDNYAEKFRKTIEKMDDSVFGTFKKISTQSKEPKKISIVHGDLNLGNIISTPRNNNFWLIDYGKTAIGLTSIDFVKPEVEIRTHILYELISKMTYDSNKSKNKDNLIEEMAESIKLIEKMLINNNINNSDLKRFGKNKDIVKTCLLFIREIRSFAFQHYYQNYKERQEYWESLFYYSMTALKFPNLYPETDNKYKETEYKFLIPLGLLELAKITAENIDVK